MMFKDTADVNQRLGKQQYIASDEIATVVYLAQSLCKPDVYKRQLYKSALTQMQFRKQVHSIPTAIIHRTTGSRLHILEYARTQILAH